MNTNLTEIEQDIRDGQKVVSLVIEDGSGDKLYVLLHGSLRRISSEVHGNIVSLSSGGRSKLTVSIPAIPDELKRKAIADALKNSNLIINRQQSSNHEHANPS